jgi:outer membrane lipoprotein SlyB
MAGIGVTIGGVSTASVGGFTGLGTTVGLTAGRADLTSTALATAIAGGTTSFAISETSDLQDGEALVVVYKDPANSAVSTIGILDGSQRLVAITARSISVLRLTPQTRDSLLR